MEIELVERGVEVVSSRENPTEDTSYRDWYYLPSGCSNAVTVIALHTGLSGFALSGNTAYWQKDGTATLP